MASAATLATLRDRVEEALVDSTNLIWATATLDEAVRQALHEYSAARPYVAMVDQALTGLLSTNGREINVSGVTGLITVVEVWAPYAAADDRPNVRKFNYWLDTGKLQLLDGAALAAANTARIFYTKLHTLNGLDAANATTFRIGDDSLIVLGAVGYAALSRAVDLVEQVRVDLNAVEQLRSLGQTALENFRARLSPLPGPPPKGEGERPGRLVG